MKRETYEMLESYMLRSMGDSAHDREHIYRVLYTALQIAEEETDVDMDVLVCACLLHDIGRQEQFENPALCHAQVGGEKAYRFLVENGFSEEYARRVQNCIVTHRFRENHQPESLEAKILFDADKLDVTGALGVARTLMYEGIVSAPLYTRKADGRISDGEGDDASSFFREYHFKLKRLYNRFYTKAGKTMAKSRQKAAEDYYQALLGEVNDACSGKEALEVWIREGETHGEIQARF